tara:strand:+ start:1017 stop:1187 length:171 start_codon:yes stop_codon:yes gene_type:complete
VLSVVTSYLPILRVFVQDVWYALPVISSLKFDPIAKGFWVFEGRERMAGKNGSKKV